MPETVTASPPTDRIPLAHSVVYAVRGVPEIGDEYNAARTIAPTEITLTYRAAPDSQLGRVHAYVKGWWMENGARVPMDKPVGRHLYGDPEAWPTWLAKEARLHDPAAVSGGQPNRAALLREVADECDEAGAAYTARALNDHAAGAFALMETFLRKANEAEYAATPCSPGGCEDGGEPCTTHERLMAHAEGDHELCGPGCARPVTCTCDSEDHTHDGGCPLYDPAAPPA